MDIFYELILWKFNRNVIMQVGFNSNNINMFIKDLINVGV